MKKISSNMTFVYKTISPILWLIMFIIALIASIISNKEFILKNILFEMSFFLITGWTNWYFYVKLKTEVYDLGNGLLIKDKNQQIRILDENINDVTFSRMQNPTMVTVYLKNSIELGQKFSFIGKRNTGFFMTKNPDIEQIIQRIQTKSQP